LTPRRTNRRSLAFLQASGSPTRCYRAVHRNMAFYLPEFQSPTVFRIRCCFPPRVIPVLSLCRTAGLLIDSLKRTLHFLPQNSPERSLIYSPPTSRRTSHLPDHAPAGGLLIGDFAHRGNGTDVQCPKDRFLPGSPSLIRQLSSPKGRLACFLFRFGAGWLFRLDAADGVCPPLV